MDIIADVRRFFFERKFMRRERALEESESLLNIIDSLAIQELIAFIETRYDIQVDEEELMPENFDSLIAIKDYVSRKISQS